MKKEKDIVFMYKMALRNYRCRPKNERVNKTYYNRIKGQLEVYTSILGRNYVEDIKNSFYLEKED